MLKNFIPVPFQGYFPEAILALPLEEKKADCLNCNHTFHPHLKCCTYHPFLPNFLVGAILKDKNTSPISLETIRNKIKNREYALPLGIIPPVSWQIPFNQRLPGEFGHRADWACPFLLAESHQCGIWKNRNSQCSSYFCKSDYGANGFEFWGHIKKHLTKIERDIATQILKEWGLEPELINAQMSFLDRRHGTRYETEISSLQLQDWEWHWQAIPLDPATFYRECHTLFLKKSPEWATPYLQSEYFLY